MQIIKDISNSSIFQPICVYHFFSISTKDIYVLDYGDIWYFFKNGMQQTTIKYVEQYGRINTIYFINFENS